LRPVRHRHPVRRDEVQKPQEGERLSSESFEALRDRHSERPVPGSVLALKPTKPAGGSLRFARRRRGGRVPLEGEQSPREARVRPLLREQGTTDFRGGQCPEGGRGSARLGSAGPFEPTPCGLGGPRGRPVPRKGNPSKGKSQERYRLKHGGRFRGEQGVKRVETLKTQRNRAG
jgi:hypothetical protein